MKNYDKPTSKERSVACILNAKVISWSSGVNVRGSSLNKISVCHAILKFSIRYQQLYTARLTS